MGLSSGLFGAFFMCCVDISFRFFSFFNFTWPKNAIKFAKNIMCYFFNHLILFDILLLHCLSVNFKSIQTFLYFLIYTYIHTYSPIKRNKIKENFGGILYLILNFVAEHKFQVGQEKCFPENKFNMFFNQKQL